MKFLWIFSVLLLYCEVKNEVVADALKCAVFDCNYSLYKVEECEQNRTASIANKQACTNGETHCYMIKKRDPSMKGYLENGTIDFSGIIVSYKYGCLEKPEYTFDISAKPFALKAGDPHTVKITWDFKEYFIDICNTETNCQNEPDWSKYVVTKAVIKPSSGSPQPTCVEYSCNLEQFRAKKCVQRTCSGKYCYKMERYPKNRKVYYMPYLSSGCLDDASEPSIEFQSYYGYKPFTTKNKCEKISINGEYDYHMNICNSGDYCNVCNSYEDGNAEPANGSGTVTTTSLLFLAFLTSIAYATLKHF